MPCLRQAPNLPLRLTLAVLVGCCCAAAQAQTSAVVQPSTQKQQAKLRAPPASCPQVDYSRELPPIAFDPRLVIQSNHVDAPQLGISRLTGSVLISQNGREFSAQQVDYDGAGQQIRVDSESLYRDPILIIKSQSLSYDLDQETGVFHQASYSLLPIDARGYSTQIDVARSGWASLQAVSFTTCAPEHESWILKADRIELDQNTGMGKAHNAWLWFEDVPILYLPYFTYPIDGERHTGFLPPIFSQTNNTGFDLRLPFYLNLAPNYDATLIPRYMTDRGAQIGGKIRYMTEQQQGTLYGEYMSYDQEAHIQRSYVNFSHEGLINQRLGVQAQYAQVSDRNYFTDLGGNVDLASTSFLGQGAQLTYVAPSSYTITARVQGYQPVTTAIATDDNPYQRLPQVTLNALTRNSYFDTRAGLMSEFTNFVRSDSVEGQRGIVQPYVRWEQDHASWYGAAQTDLSYTYYNLTDTAPGQRAEQQRALPISTLEGGLHFERITDGGKLQTLEPKLFYLYVPYHNQNQIPVFDSGEPDFDFPELFARNRYTGEDRLSDANQMTSAITTRLIDPDAGLVRVSASLGEIYRITAPRVDLPGFNTPGAGGSDYIGTVEYQLTKRWSADAIAEWNSGFNRFERTEFDIRYREPENGLNGRRLDLAYRYYNGLLQQTDVSFSTPIVDKWRIAARVRYSLFDEELEESFVGVEYETCCWAVSGAYRRYLSSTNGNFDNGVFFQLVLKGLSRIGTGFNDLLPALDPNAPIRSRGTVVP
jgi:LPS-assembly protein